MPTMATETHVQDENVVSRRVKPQPELATATAQTTVTATAKRPALSNLTNTSTLAVQHTRVQTRASRALKSKAQQQHITPVDEEQQQQQEKKSLKRAAPDAEDEEDTKPTLKKSKIHEKQLQQPQEQESVPDLDAEDADDPLMVSEYVNEIFEYLFEQEQTTTPRNYFDTQPELKPRMRSILVDWLVEVHLRFRLTPETLFLAINMMDRFLTIQSVEVDKLQLLATGCLFIAAKYEEVWSPSVKNYAYVTDGGSTEDEILTAERFILKTLNFDLSYPNPMNFLRRISKADNYDIETRTMAKYILEITIMDHKFLGTKPSLCAAASMYVSRKLLGRSDWNATLTKYSGGYSLEQMKPVVQLMVDYLRAPVTHDEFFKKYASKKYMKASILARQWTKKFDQEDVKWI